MVGGKNVQLCECTFIVIVILEKNRIDSLDNQKIKKKSGLTDMLIKPNEALLNTVT